MLEHFHLGDPLQTLKFTHLSISVDRICQIMKEAPHQYRAHSSKLPAFHSQTINSLWINLEFQNIQRFVSILIPQLNYSKMVHHL